MSSLKKTLMFGFAALLPISSSFAQEEAPRSPTYGAVVQGNVAAEFTTADYMQRGYLVKSQYLAAHTIPGNNATGSIQGLGLTWIAGVAQNGGSADIRLQMAQEDLFGVGVLYNLNSTKTVNPATESKTTVVNDGIGVFGSFNLGFGGLYAEVATRVYPSNKVWTKDVATGTVTEEKHRTTSFLAGWIKDTEGEMSPSFGGLFTLNLNGEENSANPKTLDQTATDMAITGQYGIPLKQNDEYAVFAGASATLSMISTNNKVAETKSNDLAISVTPNASFQKVLGKGFEVSAGISATVVRWLSGSDEATIAENTVESKGKTLTTTSSQAVLGLRWELDNFAIEGVIEPELLKRPGSTKDLFVSVGVAIGF